MRKFKSHMIGIAQGEVVMFNDFETGGPMWSGSGSRVAKKSVRFEEPFDEAPAVTVSVAMCDMSNEAYLRMELCAEDITRDGFDIHFGTWGDTKIARTRVTWQAIGAISSEDAWDI